MPAESPIIRSFDARAPREQLDDLRRRLRSTRWPDSPGDAGWSLGTDPRFLKELVAYWIDEFDWPAAEQRLARLPRFTTKIDGLGIHFVHARAADAGRRVLPIILNHGWPDSFWRYTKVVELLTDPGAHGADPADAFDVVVPDIPGFGYSDHPSPALNSRQVAAVFARLMSTLGYDRFVTAGGDIGSHVSRYLALDFADRVRAVHRMDAGLPAYDGDVSQLSPAERAWFEAVAAWNQAEGAYGAIQRTKPETIAAALNDSPVGLAAWIVEKLQSWSDGDIGSVYTKDEILTDVMIFWLTQSIGSSMRMYNANAALPREQLTRRVEVPSGFSIFAGDIVRPPREWIERTANAVRITEPERGGHFAPFEQPELYARELRDFFRPFRDAAM
ncbi:epoxide hydrolase family protein [Subtercola sp. YIM 133946]|uniref:epoxide hydrolase family protein n=1 Tax=Subtercola sp. YIM 133946 TaxID=3118909 RepID=UPI002F95B101